MNDSGLGLLLGVAGLGLGFFLGSLYGQASPPRDVPRMSRPGVVAEAFEIVERHNRSAGRLTAERSAQAPGPNRGEAPDVTGSVPAREDDGPQIVCRQVGSTAPGDVARVLGRP